MSKRTSRKYGLPFKGYMASLPAHSCPPDYASIGSANFTYRPADGSFLRRAGSVRVSTDVLEGGSAAGWWGAARGKAKSRAIRELQSPSLTALTYSCLYTKDVLDNPACLDDGRFGELAFKTSVATEVCGQSATTEYGTDGPGTAGRGSASANFIGVPLWYDSGEGGITRMTHLFSRRFHCSGSRGFLDVGSWRFFPSYFGTPSKWNRKFNSSGVSTKYQEQHYLSGPVPPLWCPIFSYSAEVPSTTSQNWKTGTCFYGSVMFQNEDESWSMPAVPRAVNATLTQGAGLAKLPHVNHAYYIDAVTWSVPIGPPGTIRRALLRSPSWNVNDEVVVASSPSALKIVKVIEENTSTLYVDRMGDDTALLDDPDHLYLRWDHIMPPPARHIWDFDGRTAHGYGRTSRCAIFLAPTGEFGNKSLNLPLTSAVWGQGRFYVHSTTASLELKYQSGYNQPVQIKTITYAGGKTLQEVVDEINNTSVSEPAKEWAAQIAPGASPAAVATDLLAFSVTVANCAAAASTAIVTTTSPATFANLAVGMGIATVAAKIGSGTYIKAILSATSIKLCDSLGEAKNVTGAFNTTTLTFYHDTGDPEPHDDTDVGNQRVVGGCYYGCLYFKNSHFVNEPSGKSSVWMTVGGPLQARQSANAFVSASSNKHSPPGNPGICMGGGGLADGSVVLYADERHVLRNTRGGRTGLDEDYRLDRVTRTGCISGGGIVVGYGWVGFPSWEGYIVCDLTSELNITRALWDGGSRIGEFDEEFMACIGAAAHDDDTDTFYACIVGNQLYLAYRKPSYGGGGGQTGLPDEKCRLVSMDFGEGSRASGVVQLIGVDGMPWGWSTPARFSLSAFRAMGTVRAIEGFMLYTASDPITGTTDGAIDRLAVGHRDGTNNIIADVYCAADSFDSMRHKSANDTIVKYLIPNGDTGVSFSLEGQPSGALSTVELLSDYKENQAGYSIKSIQWGQAVRGKNRTLRLRLTDSGATSGQPQFWGAESSADVLVTYD